MKSNLSSDPFELLLGILCLVCVIYISPSVIAAYFYLAKPPRTDLEDIEDGKMKIREEELMSVEAVGMAKVIEEKEKFEDVENFFNEVERLEEAESPEEFKKFDDSGGMIKETTRLRQEAYTPAHVRAKDDDWEIV